MRWTPAGNDGAAEAIELANAADMTAIVPRRIDASPSNVREKG
jgi:hypothetical protein